MLRFRFDTVEMLELGLYIRSRDYRLFVTVIGQQLTLFASVRNITKLTPEIQMH